MQIKIRNIFPILTLLLLYISLTITMLYNFNCEEVEKASNTLYSENALTFTASKKNIDIVQIKDRIPENAVFFSQMLSDRNVRGVCFNSYYNQPKLKEGRFFIADDFNGKNKLAVIGENVSTEEEGDRKYITYESEKYLVVGIVRYPLASKLDDMIFLSLNKDLLDQSVKEYVISGNSLQENLNFLGHEDVFGEVAVFENKIPNLLPVVSSGNSKNITILLVLICLIFNIYIVFYFLVERQKLVYCIKMVNGYTRQQIIFEEMKKLFYVNVNVSIIGTFLTLCAIYKKLLIDRAVVVKTIILYFGITIILFFILLYTNVFQNTNAGGGNEETYFGGILKN